MVVKRKGFPPFTEQDIRWGLRSYQLIMIMPNGTKMALSDSSKSRLLRIANESYPLLAVSHTASEQAVLEGA